VRSASPQATCTTSNLRIRALPLLTPDQRGIPAEPTVYDLLVDMQEGIKRVQVKTTTCYSKDGWAVWLAADPIRLATGNGGFLTIRNQSTGSSS